MLINVYALLILPLFLSFFPQILPQFLSQVVPVDFPWSQVERGSFIAILIWVQQSHEKRVDRISSEHRDAWVRAMDSNQDTLEKITAALAQLIELVRRGHS
jgi:hypothetical protein